MITCEKYGVLNGKQVDKYVLSDGITVEVLTLGATLLSLSTADKSGNATDVLLGLVDVHEIQNTTTYMGSVVGRCANRIANGVMTLEGKTYRLAKNDNGNAHLHGGNCGFNQKIFDARVEGDSLYLSCQSANGEENYPANLRFTVKYTVLHCALNIEYFAESDGTTVFNPTNHAYFNLNGQGNGDVSDNVLRIFASKFLPVDKKLIPTGEERNVFGTPFDFTTEKPIGKDIGAEDKQLLLAGGYDHNFCLDGNHAATAYSPKTGIVCDCFTDRCGLQFYSGNFLCGEKGKSVYDKRAGFCLETQYYPNAVNNAKWKQPVLKKGEKFYSKTTYLFSVRG